MWQNKTLETFDAALHRVLTYTVDGKGSIYWQLQDLTAHCIEKLKLQSVTKTPGAYGAPEVQLVLNDMFKQLPTRVPAETLLQQIALVQTCFITGLRIGSLVATDRHDPDRLGMRQKDVSFTLTHADKWTLHLHVQHLKGFNSALDTANIQVRMRPLQKPKNILLEPTSLFLVLLINRQALHADGADGPPIQSVEELLSSSSHRFFGVGDQLLFQNSKGGELDVRVASGQLNVHMSAVGLPYAAFHRFRQDFGM